MTLLELCEEAINSSCLIVECSLPQVTAIDDHAVVIPFNVSNVVFSKDCINLPQYVLKCPRMGDIKYLLVTSWRRSPTRFVQNPFGVCAVEIRVRVNHLALKPEPKLHALVIDVFNDWP